MSRQLDHLFNLVEGADELGDLSVWTFRRHVSAGHVKVVRLGRRVFVRRDEIDRIRAELERKESRDGGNSTIPPGFRCAPLVVVRG